MKYAKKIKISNFAILLGRQRPKKKKKSCFTTAGRPEWTILTRKNDFGTFLGTSKHPAFFSWGGGAILSLLAKNSDMKNVNSHIYIYIQGECRIDVAPGYRLQYRAEWSQTSGKSTSPNFSGPYRADFRFFASIARYRHFTIFIWLIGGQIYI